jgi:hypothetical protein
VSDVSEDSSASIVENKQSKQRRSAERQDCINPTKKALQSFDAPGNIYKRTQQITPKDLNVQEHRCHNLQSGTNSVCCVDMSTEEHKQKHLLASSTFYSAVREYSHSGFVTILFITTHVKMIRYDIFVMLYCIKFAKRITRVFYISDQITPG